MSHSAHPFHTAKATSSAVATTRETPGGIVSGSPIVAVSHSPPTRGTPRAIGGQIRYAGASAMLAV